MENLKIFFLSTLAIFSKGSWNYLKYLFTYSWRISYMYAVYWLYASLSLLLQLLETVSHSTSCPLLIMYWVPLVLPLCPFMDDCWDTHWSTVNPPSSKFLKKTIIPFTEATSYLSISAIRWITRVSLSPGPCRMLTDQSHSVLLSAPKHNGSVLSRRQFHNYPPQTLLL